MAYPWLLSLSLAFLVLSHGCIAQFQRFSTQCHLEKLSTLEPTRKVESQGGFTEYWDPTDDQFLCTGVAAFRYTIKPKGLLLPLYTNAPRLYYVIQGKFPNEWSTSIYTHFNGILETVIPGCPATFQEQSSRGDHHQKIHSTRHGDVIVVPAGSAHWIYNNGETDMVLFSIVDTANEDNQLDLKVRTFFLAGNPREEESNSSQKRWSRGMGSKLPWKDGSNVFSGLAVETVAESLGTGVELARKVQGIDDPRGSIIIAEEGIHVLSPVEEEEQQMQRERERRRRRREEKRGLWRGEGSINGLEETVCTLRLVHQLAESADADKYNPRAGHLTGLNTPNLPVLQYVQLGVDLGVLYKNAIMVPHSNLNCHAVIYGTNGSCRIQVVADNGKTAFDGEMREGQILIVPQHYVVVKKAGSDGFEWIALKTSDNPMMNPFAGRLSLLRAMPEAVLMNSYRITREEAKDLKKREELTLLSPQLGTKPWEEINKS
ncbi:hypothetical protein L6164_025844 [Bauhinia variegata]|uniref:Uncharacterized protein n=1 Tax=Bauhinia variegata TaxID=167791 RepID=A0ACB9M3D2_BAUVA|nr:hypothetical protein L6164_025844 [Bauhinia variegata]